jgi:hypothetical protein
MAASFPIAAGIAPPASNRPPRKPVELGDAQLHQAGHTPHTAAQQALIARNSCTRWTAPPATVRVK